MQYLQWAVPGGLGAMTVWLLSRSVRSARTAKEVHDTYKEMYSDVSLSLKEMRKENERLYKAVTRLERAFQRAAACRLWTECPIRSELPYIEKCGSGVVVQRQPVHGQHRIRDTMEGDGGRRRRQRKADSPDGDAAEPSVGCDVHP